MKGGSPKRGFTIIETLIVLAVTGGLFIMAAALISNRQNKAQFSEGIRDVESRIQQIISEVSTGYYPNNGNFRCTEQADGPRLENVGGTQGTNEDCIFLGKVMHFAVDSDDSSQVNVYSLVGLREKVSSSDLVDSLTDARPRLVAEGNSDPDGTIPNVFDIVRVPYGLTVEWMRYNGTNTAAAVGFVSRLGASLGDDDTSQQIDLLVIPGPAGTDKGETQLNTVDRVKTSVRTSPVVNPPGGVKICLRSGGTEQSAIISIGGSGRQLSVSTSVKNNTTCS